MLTKEQLQEAKNKASHDLRSYVNEHNDKWSAENETEYARLNAAIDEADKALAAAIAAEQRAARVKQLEEDSKRAANNPHGIGRGSHRYDTGEEEAEKTSRLALSGFFKERHANAEERKAMAEIGIAGQTSIEVGAFDTGRIRAVQQDICERGLGYANRSLREQTRTMSAINATTGGYTVPASFQAALEVNMLAYGSVLSAARILQTSGGEEIRFPTFDDTTNTASATSENTDQGSASDPTFGRMSWSAYDVTTGMLKVPRQLLTDSVFDIDSMIAEAMGTRLARKSEVDLTTGNGVNKPYGVATASSLGVTTASATAITYEELMDLKQALPLAYRGGGSFMMHDDVTHYIRKLKDSEGRYLWVNGTEPGMPNTLCGAKVYVNQAMAGFTNGALVLSTKHVLFGNFNNYIVRRAGGIVLSRVNERYVETNQVGYIANWRIDGNVLSAGATQIVHMIQHS